MFMLGQSVKVLPPFLEFFGGIYEITEVVNSGDGTTAYILGEHGGFDETYLELA